MLGRLEDAILLKLKEVNLLDDILQQMPYSVWPIEDLEVGLQIMNERGIHDFIEKKVNDPENFRWEWQSYIRHHFPEHLPAKKLFSDEYKEIFSQLRG